MNKDNIRRIFASKKGLRLVWLIALAAGLYVASVGGASAAYWHAYEKMMAVWGITSENVIHAPGWTQFLYSWSNVIVQIIQNALILCSAMWLFRIAGLRKANQAGAAEGIRRWGRGALTGAVCMAAMWVFLLAIGSVRLGWRIGKPAFSVNTAALFITAMANSAGECAFFYGGVWGIMKKRLPVWAAYTGMAAVSALTALLSGIDLPMALVNRALMALVCCALSERAGAVGAAGFRFAWSFMDQAILGFAGATAALYETYPVNMYWLNGGNSGIMGGWLVALALCALLGFLLRDRLRITLPLRKASGKSPT